MKKIISLMLALTVMFSMGSTVLAVERASTSVEYAQPITYSAQLAYDDYLNGNLKSTSIPQELYDLSKKNYTANLQTVGIYWLYTNYYFYGNKDGKLNVTYTIYSDTGRLTSMEVGLYDLDDKRMETTWLSSAAPTTGITESFQFKNLDPTHRYAVAFKAVPESFTHDTVHGSAIISH